MPTTTAPRRRIDTSNLHAYALPKGLNEGATVMVGATGGTALIKIGNRIYCPNKRYGLPFRSMGDATKRAYCKLSGISYSALKAQERADSAATAKREAGLQMAQLRRQAHARGYKLVKLPDPAPVVTRRKSA